METNNLSAFDTMAKMDQVLSQNNNIAVSISGGSDSDILIDLVEKNKKPNNEISYVFFDTGLEYDATRRHLDFIEDKYGIEITKVRAVKPIPKTVREYGVPFKNKRVSEFIQRLQNHDFEWTDIYKGHEWCLNNYTGCISALNWLFGQNQGINCPRYLRNYLAENGLDFKVTNKCCNYAKKAPAHKYSKEHPELDLWITGVRREEGGDRANLTNCYRVNDNDVNYYMPILHWTSKDKEEYATEQGVVNSDCYKVWGMKRTGCAGCPFAREWENELELIQKHEPKFYNAVVKLFGKSYEEEYKIQEWRKNNKPSSYELD